MNIKKIISILLFAISITMIMIGFYIFNSNKYIFETILSKSLDYFIEGFYSENLVLDGMLDSDKYKLDTNIDVKYLGVKFGSITGDVYINNNEFYLNLDSNLVGENFIGLESLIRDNKNHFKIKEAMNSFYYVDLFDSINKLGLEDVKLKGILEIEKKELKILTNHLKNSILKNIEDDDFEKNSEVLTINNKKYKTNNLSLKLSGVELRNIVISFLENISNDTNAIKVLQRINNKLTKKDITTALEAFKEHSVNAVKEESIEISFYISGLSNVLRTEISTFNSDIVDSIATSNLTIVIDNYINSSNNKEINVVFKENNSEIIKYHEIKKGENISEFSLGFDNASTIKGEYIKNIDEINFILDMIYDNKSLGVLTYKNSIVNENKEYILELKLTSNNEPVEFDLISNIKLNQNIPNINIEDSNNFENINQSEIDKINKYISDQFTKFGLEEYLSNFELKNDSIKETGYSTTHYKTITVDKMKELIDSNAPVVVWFGQQACSACVDFSSVLNESYWDYTYDINYIDINTLNKNDFNTLKVLDEKLNIQYTPTTVVLQNGTVKDIKVGSMSINEYYNFLNKNGVK